MFVVHFVVHSILHLGMNPMRTWWLSLLHDDAPPAASDQGSTADSMLPLCVLCATVACRQQVREANQMVEEMMLLANCTVAEHILAAFPACALLRRHAVPPPRQFEPLLRAAAACSLDLDASGSKVRAAEPLNAAMLNRSTLAC